MDKSKLIFLCLILLFVLVVSNYMTVEEGFISTANAKKLIDDKIKTLTAKLNATTTSVNKTSADINTQNTRHTKLINDTTAQMQKNASDNVVNIAGIATNVENTFNAIKTISNDITTKATEINNSVATVKSYVDQAIQQRTDIEKIITEFKKSSDIILKNMALEAANIEAKKAGMSSVPTTTTTTPPQGFQNMKDSIFPPIAEAYNGHLQLEGFSTNSDSAYLNNADLFQLEKNVVSALKNFNETYYDYRKCLHDNPTTSASQCASKLGNLGGKKDAVITAINAFNIANVAMNAKLVSSSTQDANGNYVDNGKRITQDEFLKRHAEIKTTARAVSALRAELDMKMANLLDKKKGPFPEAKNKYNSENYVTVGWSILATSILYYVFVEMK